MQTAHRSLAASFSSLTIAALMLGAFAPFAHAATPVTVTIESYVDGQQASALSANSIDFPMLANYTIGGTTGGPSPYALSASGYNGDPTPYQAMTGGLSTGDDYATNEDTTGADVGASCSDGKPFALVGYSSGTTLAAAQAGPLSLTPPSFSALTDNQFVIVWNTNCAPTLAAPTAVSPANGTSTTTANQTSASWTNVSDAAGGITYVFQVSHSAATNLDGSFATQIYNSAPLSTNSISTVGTTDGTYYWHVRATDADGRVSTWSPTSMFIVDNTGVSGTLSGSSSGGTPPEGALAVTSVTTVNATATADGTFANGWKYMFHITVPTTETHLAMKFADWFNATASSTVAAANNIRISSAQADNAGATVLLTAANTYSTPMLHMTTDLDAGTPGMQVDVLVETSVPPSTINGSYTTSYGIETLP